MHEVFQSAKLFVFVFLGQRLVAESHRNVVYLCYVFQSIGGCGRASTQGAVVSQLPADGPQSCAGKFLLVYKI